MSAPFTKGKARIATETAATVVAIGQREICECYEDGEVQTAEDEGNARRIVACWNACDGINTERLELADMQQLVRHYRDALTLLEGWIAKHCPAQHRAEHLADLERKRSLVRAMGFEA